MPSTIKSEGLAAVFVEPEGPRGVRVEERPRTPAEPGEVVVQVRAASLNHLDLWLASGAQRVEPPRVISADGAGVVAESTDPRWKAGDEVVVYPVTCDWSSAQSKAGQQVFAPGFGIVGEDTDGTACQFLHVAPENLFPRPRGLSWPESAAFPLTFLTAWRMIVTRARLQPGETMLVVGAGAGVAAAAITIGKHLGARVLATSRSEEKRGRAEALGADATFPSEDFGRAAKAATGAGVDVVFEHVGPATLDQSIRAVRPGGRIVFCGSTSGTRAEFNMPRLFLGQLDLLGSTMGNLSEFQALLAAIEDGMRPVVDSVYPLDQVQEALTHLDQGEQFGKVVLEIPS
ncbi:MAG: zinc-binding dehydrogenase [Candidatus Dormibacteraeota bacterium]|nr:zinc-binding dehydrogenase [Candidatus Dormibacteraeota bacterium]